VARWLVTETVSLSVSYCIHLLNQPKAQCQIQVNSKDTTPKCFSKDMPSSGSTCAKVKTSYKWWDNIYKIS